MDGRVQGGLEMLTEAVYDNSDDPAAHRNEAAEENDGKQVNVMLRLLISDSNQRRIGTHYRCARHDAEHNHTNSCEDADRLRYLT